MGALRKTTCLVLATAMVACGCTSSRWASHPSDDAWPDANSTANAPDSYPETAPAVGTSQQAPADPQALLDVMAEVRHVGALDPAAEAELLKNLRQTRPELWPLVVQQFRAALDYRNRSDQQKATPASFAANETAAAPLPGEMAAGGAAPLAAEKKPPNGPEVAATEQAGTAADRPEAEAAPVCDDRVEPVSYDEKSNRGQKHLDDAIRAMETKVSDSPASPDEIAEHARLRMLYLLAGRRDEALKPIPAVAPGTQDFWSNEIYGLAALLDGTSSATPSRLAAEAHRPLDEAACRLAESCPLVLSNLAFVTHAQSYGVYTRFKKYEFEPGQKLLLYAEVTNFKSAETEKGFVTSLKSSYQIFEPGGRRVAEHEFDVNEDCCTNRRHDFFIGYEFCLPKRIYGGTHILKLTVEDVASGKVGESSIEFTVTGE